MQRRQVIERIKQVGIKNSMQHFTCIKSKTFNFVLHCYATEFLRIFRKRAKLYAALTYWLLVAAVYFNLWGFVLGRDVSISYVVIVIFHIMMVFFLVFALNYVKKDIQLYNEATSAGGDLEMQPMT